MKTYSQQQYSKKYYLLLNFPTFSLCKIGRYASLLLHPHLTPPQVATLLHYMRLQLQKSPNVTKNTPKKKKQGLAFLIENSVRNRIRMFLGILDPHPDPDLYIIKLKTEEKP
jgi:hypothetical protein